MPSPASPAVPTVPDSDRLLAALEPILARPRRPISAGAAEALLNAEEAVASDPVRAWLESEERIVCSNYLRALRLAPDIDTCAALLRGEKVHISRLDTEWAKRYGLL